VVMSFCLSFFLPFFSSFSEGTTTFIHPWMDVYIPALPVGILRSARWFLLAFF
jgi:hypothetical protein